MNGFGADRLAVAVFLAWFVACGSDFEAPPGSLCPGCNIVLVSLDTLRADHLGTYGYDRPTSPCIDAFAEGAVRFDNAVSHSSWTLPSHASLLTSLLPSQHGVVSRERRLGPHVETLPSVLEREDWATGAFVAGYNVSAVFGLDRGFEVFQEHHRGRNPPGQGPRLHQVLRSASRWLRDNSGRRFFLLLHAYDAHGPYLAHEGIDFTAGYAGPLLPLSDHERFRKSELFPVSGSASPDDTINDFYGKVVNQGQIDLTDVDRAFLVALYDGEIRFVDDHFCSLLAELDAFGVAERTIVALTSDHGESFFERGTMGHGGPPFEELMRVPLIVRVPGQKGAASATLARGIDLAPTLLHLVGVPVPRAFQGRSLWPLDAERPAVAIAEGGPEGAIRRGRWKLIEWRQGFKLFDLRNDPFERSNVADAHPDLATSLRAELSRARGRVTLGDDRRENLRALGYVE